ncbi:MAG TPA: NUDIX hydrolase [Bacillota bacterium]|nr:NUDIX hydrolase [Bacillota bacterium]
MVKQIFRAYQYQGNAGNGNLKYCSECGAECFLKESDGRIRSVCCACGFIHYKNPAPGVSVLIAKEGRVLLGKRAPGNYGAGRWCLPCGYIEYDEDFLTAGVREVEEETGLQVEIKSIINVNANFLAPGIHTLVIVLFGQVIGGSLKPGDDIGALGWFDPLELPELAFEADQYIIDRYRVSKLEGLTVE